MCKRIALPGRGLHPKAQTRGPDDRTALRFLLAAAAAVALAQTAHGAVTVGPEYTFPGNDSRSCDICIHPSTGHPHVVWETNDGHIRHSRFDGTRWTAPEQIPGAENVEARKDKFRNGAVAAEIDSAGRMHVVYCATGPRFGLYHVRQKTPGGAWSAPVLVHDAQRAACLWVQMARGKRDELFAGFEKASHAYVCVYNGSSWTRPAMLHPKTSHVHHAAAGPDGAPRIIFKAKLRGGYEGHLATRTSKGWKTVQITRGDGNVDCPAGAVDASNRLHVIWSRCDEEGHDAVLKYARYTGSPMAGVEIAKTNAHNFCRLIFDDGGAMYAFMPRRYPPKFVVRETPTGPWSEPIAFGPARQGYWLFEAAARGNEVHVVYSNGYGPDRRKGVTYRKITRTKGKATTAAPPGRGLVPDPSNRRWLVHGDKHIALSGNGLWVLVPDTDVDIATHNAHASRWGANTNRITLFTGCDKVNGGELAPWARTGPGKANDGRPKYDLTRFDRKYWARAVEYVRDAVGRGIYPVIQIWCEPYVERGEGRWIVHPFNPDNHVNNIPKLPTGSSDAGRDGLFYNTGNPKLRRFQEAFVTKALDELGRFPVIWDIGNEVGFDTKISDTWMQHWADFLDAYEELHPGVRLLVTVDTSGDRGHFERIRNLDVINVHGFHSSGPFTLDGTPVQTREESRVDVKRLQQTLHRHYVHFRRPVLNTRLVGDPDYSTRPLKDRPGNALETRHILWGYFFGGAHFISFRTPDATGKDPQRWNAPPLTTERTQVHLRTFIESFEFWKCTPRVMGIVASSDAVVLAETGRQYAFYAPNGAHFGRSFSANLSEAKALEGRWFNPRDGRFGKAFPVAVGPEVKFTLPTDEDWALLLLPVDSRPEDAHVPATP